LAAAWNSPTRLEQGHRGGAPERNPVIHWLATEMTAWSVVMLKVGVAMFIVHLWRQRRHRPPAIALARFAAVERPSSATLLKRTLASQGSTRKL
jgi:hypothetical protein